METFGSHAIGVRRLEVVRSVDGSDGWFRLLKGQGGERPTPGHATVCPQKATGHDTPEWLAGSARCRVGWWSSPESSVAVLTCHDDPGWHLGREIGIEFIRRLLPQRCV